MKRISKEQRELLEEIDEARKIANGIRAEKSLLSEIDALEQSVKNVGVVGRKLKRLHKNHQEALQLIWEKLYTLTSQHRSRSHRRTLLLAILIAFFFLSLYILAGFARQSIPQHTVDRIAWLCVGVVGSAVVYGHFILLNYAHVTVIRWNVRRSRISPSSFSFKIYIYFMVVHFTVSYFNMFYVLLMAAVTWVYPFSFPFLHTILNSLLQGDTWSIISSVIIGSGTIVGFIGGILSIWDFLEKRRGKKQGG